MLRQKNRFFVSQLGFSANARSSFFTERRFSSYLNYLRKQDVICFWVLRNYVKTFVYWIKFVVLSSSSRATPASSRSTHRERTSLIIGWQKRPDIKFAINAIQLMIPVWKSSRDRNTGARFLNWDTREWVNEGLRNSIGRARMLSTGGKSC